VLHVRTIFVETTPVPPGFKGGRAGRAGLPSERQKTSPPKTAPDKVEALLRQWIRAEVILAADFQLGRPLRPPPRRSGLPVGGGRAPGPGTRPPAPTWRRELPGPDESRKPAPQIKAPLLPQTGPARLPGRRKSQSARACLAQDACCRRRRCREHIGAVACEIRLGSGTSAWMGQCSAFQPLRLILQGNRAGRRVRRHRRPIDPGEAGFGIAESDFAGAEKRMALRASSAECRR